MFRSPVNILASACLLLTASVSYAAEGVLETFTDAFSSACLAFDYTYGYEASGVKFTGNGNIILKGDSFIMKGDGLEIYCDGTTRWTMDRKAEEMVIESYDSHSEDLSANPAILLRRLTAFFEVSSQSGTEYSGEKAIKVDLTPKSYPQFRSVTLYFRSSQPDSDILIGASIAAADGTVTDFMISDFRYGPKGDADRFSFDEKSLGPDWIITDLR